MITIVSPSKSLDFETLSITKEYSVPAFLDQSEKLMKGLKKMSAKKLGALMNISPKIGRASCRERV